MSTEPRQPAATLRQRLARTMGIDAALPGPIRRWKWRGLLVVLVAGLAAFAVLAIDAAALPFSTIAGWNIPLMLAMFAGVLLCKRAARRVVGRAAAADHLLCPECTYDLRTLDEAGACPECGRAYEHGAVRAQWLDAQRRLKRR